MVLIWRPKRLKVKGIKVDYKMQHELIINRIMHDKEYMIYPKRDKIDEAKWKMPETQSL